MSAIVRVAATVRVLSTASPGSGGWSDKKAGDEGANGPVGVHHHRRRHHSLALLGLGSREAVHDGARHRRVVHGHQRLVKVHRRVGAQRAGVARELVGGWVERRVDS